MQQKDIIYLFIILGLLVVGGFLFFQYSSSVTVVESVPPTNEQIPVEPDGGIGDGAEPLDEVLSESSIETIGQSVEGNNIDVYRFGNGDIDILLVGGAHGGYSWNTTALAYELIEYYELADNEVPEGMTVHIIPALNPDGLIESIGTYETISVATARAVSEAERIDGRFNANGVDLNRNFACNWQPESNWRNRTVSGGDEAFSEPEAAALRNYVDRIDPAAAIVWFAAEGKVYPSACEAEASTASIALANTFAEAANYDVDPVFDAYTISGDMVNWMARENIPAISVLLTDFADTEFTDNVAGVEAVLDQYAN